MARIYPDKVPPPERTAREQLEELTKMNNWKVQRLINAAKKSSDGDIGDEYDDEFDRAIDRTCKLAREERMGDGPDLSKLTDEQVLALQKRPNASSTTE